MLWLPVGLGLGIAACFALPGAPPLWLGLAALAMGTALGLAALRIGAAGRGGQGALLLGLATLALGFGLGTARTHLVAAPLIPREASWRFTGRVAAIEATANGHRLRLDRLAIDRLPAERTPAAVRINLRKGGDQLVPGDRVRVLARLQRPLPPALPGGFDFGRQAWFDGLGGLGFALGTAERGEGAGQERDRLGIASLRAGISARILEVVPGDSGAVAAALVTGVRAGIGQHVWRDFQVSGLAHILAISGLHMVLVAGALVLTLRWGLALIPPLALRVPVKKIAAGIAIPGSAFYLLLAGATVPTQRAFLMITVALLAVIFDRNPLSMRLLAWAALVVLTLRPEALLGASFQLSFAAVLALGAVYETLIARNLLRADGATAPGRKVLLYVGGVALTTLIAGTATAPLAAFHFQTIPTYGVLANLIAVPVTSFLVMPAGMIAMLLMPLGLDGWPLRLMAAGVDIVVATAHYTAALPGASLRIGLLPTGLLVLFTMGGLWLALWRRRWRWLGLVPCGIAVLGAVLHRPPDLLVDPRLDMAAWRSPAGEVLLAEWRRGGLVRDAWLRGEGVTTAGRWPRPGERPGAAIACDAAACTVRLGPRTVSLVRRVTALAEDCRRADLVIARVGPETCPGPARLIGPRALLRSGGLAVRLAGDALAIETVAEARGDWPWARAAGAAPGAGDASGEAP